MFTKFDIDENVLIPATIVKIEINPDTVSPIYTVNIDSGVHLLRLCEGQILKNVERRKINEN